MAQRNYETTNTIIELGFEFAREERWTRAYSSDVRAMEKGD